MAPYQPYTLQEAQSTTMNIPEFSNYDEMQNFSLSALENNPLQYKYLCPTEGTMISNYSSAMNHQD
jgi:hypothetical protein